MKQYSYYIDYLNKEKNFAQDRKSFTGKNGYEKATRWGKKHLDNFHMDMIKINL